MRGQRFSTPEEAVDAFRMHVLEIPQSEWQKCFDNWFKRIQKCIDLNGEYFKTINYNIFSVNNRFRTLYLINCLKYSI